MKTILLPVDIFHETGWEGALKHAVSLARLHGAALHVLTVIPDFGMPMVGSFFPTDFSKRALAEAEENLTAFVAANIPDGIDVTTHVKHGNIYKEILAVADATGTDMIVMASHRLEMSDYLLGPNAARVVRHARQSVCVIR
jgi:nucleotide-binding universal stress UspA family protein